MDRFLDGLAVWTLVAGAFVGVVAAVIGVVAIAVEIPLAFGLITLFSLFYWSFYRTVNRDLNPPWRKR